MGFFTWAAQAATFEERSEQLLAALRGQSVPAPGVVGKQPYSTVLAHLAANPSDVAALNFTAQSSYGGEVFFNSIGQVRAFYMARARFSAEQVASLRAIATGFENWNNTGTENHRTMTWSSGYLLAQAFPDAQWNFRIGGQIQSIGSAEMMARLKENLADVGRARFAAGYSEFVSPNYEIFNLAALVNLYDFAEDPEMRAIAEAYLTYHFSCLALASLEEITMAPYNRSAEQSRELSANSQWVSWIYWGVGNPVLPPDPTLPTAFFALSDWRPAAVLDAVVSGVADLEYTARFQLPHWQWNPDRYVLRTTWRGAGMGMSSGVVRHVPGAFQLDDTLFSIAWSGTASRRHINVMHPYWRSVSGGENDWKGATSPFMQTGQMENAAMILFDIPAEDPWAGIGQWASERGAIIPLAQLRYPDNLSYDDSAAADGWYFLSAPGGYYIGIKVLRPDGEGVVSRDRRSLVGYHVLKSRGVTGQRWRTGFIIELGSAGEYASLDDFKAACLDNAVSADWDAMVFDYTSNRGHALQLEYNTSTATPDGSVPVFRVNGRAVNYVDWPEIESPWVHLAGGVLELMDPADPVVIDWTEAMPQITRSEVRGGARWQVTRSLGVVEGSAYPTVYDPELGWVEHHLPVFGVDGLFDHGRAAWIGRTDLAPYFYDFSAGAWMWQSPSSRAPSPEIYRWQSDAGWVLEP